MAVILLGHKGAGKSTTAASLVASGCGLIADDVVAIRPEPGRPAVLPAHGLVKLWSDSAVQLGPASERRLWQLHDTVDKAQFQLGDAVSPVPVPVGRLYLLGRGAVPRVQALPAENALPAALEHAYMARFGLPGFGGTLPRHFATLATLAGAGRVRQLTVPDGLGRLAEISGLIRDDLAGDESRPSVQPLRSSR